MPAAPIVFGREFFEVDPRSTALIVIDMQNAFVAEGATYETPPARTMLPNLERIINFARGQGMPIIWTQSDHSAPFGGSCSRNSPQSGKTNISGKVNRVSSFMTRCCPQKRVSTAS